KSGLSPEEIEGEGGPLNDLVRWRATITSGDALFIPCGWWHYLTSFGQSISLNVWHGTGLSLKDELVAFIRSGPSVWARVPRGFVGCGLLGRPYQQRLFSPPPLGVELYRRLRRPRG